MWMRGTRPKVKCYLVSESLFSSPAGISGDSDISKFFNSVEILDVLDFVEFWGLRILSGAVPEYGIRIIHYYD